MWTVPAQIFCAPTRAALIAAARFIPGVCGILVSRLSPGMTRTPVCFQPSGGISWLWSWPSCGIWSLSLQRPGEVSAADRKSPWEKVGPKQPRLGFALHSGEELGREVTFGEGGRDADHQPTLQRLVLRHRQRRMQHGAGGDADRQPLLPGAAARG